MRGNQARYQKGFILLALTCLLSGIGALALYASFLKQTQQEREKIAVFSRRAAFDVRQKSAISIAEGNFGWDGSFYQTVETTANAGPYQTHKNFALRLDRGLGLQSGMTGNIAPKKFPQFDYQDFFSQALPCPVGQWMGSKSGIALNQTCDTSKGFNLKVGKYFGNLTIDKKITLSGSEKILATVGSLESKETIYINGSATIVAGGGIHLKKVAFSGINDELVILAASGVLTVDSIQGFGKIAAIAWDKISLPFGTVILNDSKKIALLLPQRKLAQLVGNSLK